MKFTRVFAFMLLVFSCTPPAPKPDTSTANAAVPTQDSLIAVQQDVRCQDKGKLIEKFEQNNALFERLSNEQKELEWLKITTKDGKCTILDDIKTANHYSVTFEDWDKDGFKDRIDNLKWDYRVNLFDKTKNDFSRHINGRFCGDQWDFDKSQNLKYQFLENKMGGSYELYKLVDTTKTIISQVGYVMDYDGNNYDRIEIRKNLVETPDELKFDTLAMDKQLFSVMKINENEDGDIHIAKVKKGVEAYWRKNLSLFMKK